MAKQDCIFTRTAAALERKISARKRFSEVMGIATDAKDASNALELRATEKWLVFSRYEELNSFVEEFGPSMEMDTQKTVGASFDFELFGYGTITFAVGLDGNGEGRILVTVLVDGKHLYRQAHSSGFNEDGTRHWWWFGDNGDDNGQWKTING